jgi:predicted transcriptional regulator
MSPRPRNPDLWKKPFTVRLSAEDVAALQAIADRERKPAATLASDAVSAWIRRQKKPAIKTPEEQAQ